MKRLRDEANLQRVLDILITRRRIDTVRLNEETLLEKERLKYENEKRQSMRQTLKSFNESIAQIRSRILPAEEVEVTREEIVSELVDKILESSSSFETIKAECKHEMDNFEIPLFDYHEAFRHGDDRRHTMSIGMAGKHHRQFWYNDIKENNELSLCDWGYEAFLTASEESAKEINQNKYTNSAPMNIQDGMSLNLEQ